MPDPEDAFRVLLGVPQEDPTEVEPTDEDSEAK